MAKKKKVETKQPSFEQGLAELEAVVAKLEGGQLDLDASLEQYEQGVRHLKSCYRLLNEAERRIELVAGVDAQGRATTTPFEDVEDESLTEKSASRSRRRSATEKSSRQPRKSDSDVDDGSSLF